MSSTYDMIDFNKIVDSIDQWVNKDKKFPKYELSKRNKRHLVIVPIDGQQKVEFEEVLPGDGDFLGFLADKNSIKRVRILHSAINHPVEIGVVVNKRFLSLYSSLKTLSQLYNAVDLIKKSKLNGQKEDTSVHQGTDKHQEDPGSKG